MPSADLHRDAQSRIQGFATGPDFPAAVQVDSNFKLAGGKQGLIWASMNDTADRVTACAKQVDPCFPRPPKHYSGRLLDAVQRSAEIAWAEILARQRLIERSVQGLKLVRAGQLAAKCVLHLLRLSGAQVDRVLAGGADVAI